MSASFWVTLPNKRSEEEGLQRVHKMACVWAPGNPHQPNPSQSHSHGREMTEAQLVQEATDLFVDCKACGGRS